MTFKLAVNAFSFTNHCLNKLCTLSSVIFDNRSLSYTVANLILLNTEFIRPMYEPRLSSAI